MRIIIQSDIDVKDFFKGLDLITCGANLSLSDIFYDDSLHQITIPIKRRSYERKRLFLFGESLKLLSSEWINSSLIIRNVIEHKIVDNLHLTNIQLLFGIKISNKEIYFCSVEEKTGVSALEVSIKVSSYDIEIRDEIK